MSREGKYVSDLRAFVEIAMKDVGKEGWKIAVTYIRKATLFVGNIVNYSFRMR